MREDSWNFATIGETDFYTDDIVESATHLLIINSNAPSNLPSILGVELARAEKEGSRVGYVTSKHVLTRPHRVLNELNPMWPLFQYKETLILIINSPPTISSNPSAHRNEWLFNYPPARDIVMRFKNLKRIGTLSTFALNRLYTEPSPMPEQCEKVDGSQLGTDDAQDTLQSIWSWLPVEIGSRLGIPSTIYLMPSEEAVEGLSVEDMSYGALGKITSSKKISPVQPAKFKEMCDMLRKDGFKIPPYSAKRAQDSYIGLSSEALERIKELIGATNEITKTDTGAMFQ